MASHRPTSAVAEDNHSVGVLCHQRLVEPTSNVQLPRCGRGDTHSGKVGIARKKQVDGHKKEPREVHAPGVATGCCLSLWALLIRAAGSGDGDAAPDRALQRKIRITSRYGFGYLPFRHNNDVIGITGTVEPMRPLSQTGQMRWPVSKRVNSSRADADDATLIEPTAFAAV